MSAIQPDQAAAQRLAGLIKPPPSPPELNPTTGDGSLVDDPAVRAPLVLGGRSFNDAVTMSLLMNAGVDALGAEVVADDRDVRAGQGACG